MGILQSSYAKPAGEHDYVEIRLVCNDHMCLGAEIITNKIWCACFDARKKCCPDMNNLERHVEIHDGKIRLLWDFFKRERAYTIFITNMPINVKPSKYNFGGVERRDTVRDSSANHFVAETIKHLTKQMIVADLVHIGESLSADILYAMPISYIRNVITNYPWNMGTNYYSKHSYCGDIRVCNMYVCCNHLELRKRAIHLDHFPKEMSFALNNLILYPEDMQNGTICDMCLHDAQCVSEHHDVVVIDSLRHRDTLAKMCMTAIRLSYHRIDLEYLVMS